MIKHKAWLVLFLIAAATPAAYGQINCNSSTSANKMACLIPTTVTSAAPSGYTFSSTSPNPTLQNSFDFLTSDIGGELSQIPLASPASGIIFTTDPTLHVPVPANSSLGPILTQRADTIGRHKLYFATTYQYFLLKDVDGLSLNSMPVSAFFLDSSSTSGPNTLAAVNSDIQLKIHQFVGYLTYGLTSRVDVSVAVPVLRVDMRYTMNERLYNTSGVELETSNGTHTFTASNAEEATGLGDIVIAAKGSLWKFAHGGGIAAGAQLRLPTGDAQNFLGSGTIGGEPFATFTYGARISPHFNVAYQFNGNTVLVSNTTTGGNGQLPDRLLYSGGADWRVTRRFTLAADVLAQRVFNAPRATVNDSVTPFPSSSLTLNNVISSTDSSYNRDDGSVGFKVKVVGNLLVTGNLLMKLNQGGLRERLAPLVGVSYTF